MALWTPYCDQALDLRKHVHKERGSSSSFTIQESRPYVFPYNAISAHQHQANRFVPMPQLYNYSYAVQMPQCSPSSSRSWCSKSPSASPTSHSVAEHDDTESLYDDEEYVQFEKDGLKAMEEKNGGSLVANNPRMRRTVQRKEDVDDAYRRQRERNNLAAKASRDKRKLREAKFALQVTFLKKKVATLHAQLKAKNCGRCYYY